MDLSELLAKFKSIGGENTNPETAWQTKPPSDPMAPMENPPVPATADLVTPQGSPDAPPAPGLPMAGIPLPQTSDTITPQPQDPNSAPGTPDKSLFDQVSSRYQDAQKAGDVGGDAASQLAALRLKSVSRDPADSDFEPDEETPKEATAAATAPKTEGYQLGTKENLESAQKKNAILNLLGGLSDTGSEFLNNTKAIGDMFTKNPNGVHYGNDTGNTLRAQGDQVLKNQKDLVANQVNDPKSQASAEMRNLARQMGFPVSDNVSAADMDKKFPGLSNIYSAKEAAKARAATAAENNKSREEIARENREARRETAEMMAKVRNEDRKDKTSAILVQHMKDDLDPDKARGGNMAANQKQIYQAERLEQLYTEANGDLRNLDSRQMEELAIGLNKLLSGSSTGASHQIEALVPKTAAGNAQKLAEWLSNNPHGTDQLKFVQRMSETVQREKDIAKKQVQDAQKKRLTAYSKLKDTDPDSYNQILSGYGLNSDEGKPSMTKNIPDMSGPKLDVKPGSVKMIAPDGTIRMIPQDQVEKAIAAGGKLAQ